MPTPILAVAGLANPAIPADAHTAAVPATDTARALTLTGIRTPLGRDIGRAVETGSDVRLDTTYYATNPALILDTVGSRMSFTFGLINPAPLTQVDSPTGITVRSLSSPTTVAISYTPTPGDPNWPATFQAGTGGTNKTFLLNPTVTLTTTPAVPLDISGSNVYGKAVVSADGLAAFASALLTPTGSTAVMYAEGTPPTEAYGSGLVVAQAVAPGVRQPTEAVPAGAARITTRFVALRAGTVSIIGIRSPAVSAPIATVDSTPATEIRIPYAHTFTGAGDAVTIDITFQAVQTA